MEARQNDSFKHRTVGEIVAEDYRRASVFKRYGIDFCCGGGISLEAACTKKGVDYADLHEALVAADRGRPSVGAQDARSWAPSFLALYIQNVHHAYVRESLPVLVQFARKVAHVHGGDRPELITVAQLVDELAVEMEEHMTAEEQILFPRIQELDAMQKGISAANSGLKSSMRGPIDQMEHEHDHAGSIMARLREITAGYQPPPGACNTYRATFAKLEEFEDDLHLHVHLENNILFPQALTLETTLAENVAA